MLEDSVKERKYMVPPCRGLFEGGEGLGICPCIVLYS